MRSTLENPMIGLDTLLLIHASATWLIFQPCFFASSSTRSMILRSASVCPDSDVPVFFSPSERVVVPKAEAGRARLPRQRGAHWDALERETRRAGTANCLLE